MYEIIFRESEAQIIAPDEYWLYFALEDFLNKFKKLFKMDAAVINI